MENNDKSRLSVTICYCSGITDTEIRDAYLRGDLNDLYAEGLSGFCGGCREDIEEILDLLEPQTGLDFEGC